MNMHVHGTPSELLIRTLEEARKVSSFKLESDMCITIDDSNVNPCKQFTKVLILWEPESVLPQNYRKRKWNNFELVVVLSPFKPVISDKQRNCIMPLEIQRIELRDEIKRKHEIVMMNDLKFSASKFSLYGMRRKFLVEFEKRAIPHSLYGTNWKLKPSLEIRKRLAAVRSELTARNMPNINEAFSFLFHPYKQFRGSVDQKIDAFQYFTHGLVIENDINILTEKVFDSVFSGLITFYMGPDLEFLGENRPPVIQLPLDFDGAIRVIQNEMSTYNYYGFHEDLGAYLKNSDSMKFCSVSKIGFELAELFAEAKKLHRA